MKFFTTCTISLLALLISSCSKGDLVDKSKSKYYYKNSKSKIFFKSENAPDVTALWDYEWVEVPADEKSFSVIDSYYAKDKQRYFKHGKILDVDYNTFVIGYNGLLKDINHVYKNRNTDQILKEANPLFFERIKPANFSLKDDQYWSRDDKHYFMQDEIMDVNYQSFDFLNLYFFSDDNSIYYFYGYKKLGKIKNKNLANAKFTVLDDYVIHTDNFFYFYKYIGQDSIIEIPVKNPASIKMYSKRDYFSIDNLVYNGGKVIENADAKTFETLKNASGDAIWFSKDKDNVYFGVEIMPDANPKTVKYNKEEQTIEDEIYIWQWSDDTKKYIRVKKIERK